MTMEEPQSPNETGAKKGPRARDVPAPLGTIQLQERDMNLLIDLFHYGCMLRGQIQKLYFGSVQRTNMRLRQLFDAGYAKKATLPLPPCMGLPFGCQTAYMLGAKAIPLVAAWTGMDPSDIRSLQRHGTPAYLLHTVEIVEFRLALEEAIRKSSGVWMETFLPERLCLHRYEYRERSGSQEKDTPTWRTDTYKPDAIFTLAWQERKVGFAVEVDLGHTSSTEFITKINIHTRYAQSGLFAKRYGVEKARTLVITTGAHRRDNLKALAERQENARFWFSTFADVANEGVLGAIWYAPFEERPVRLQSFPHNEKRIAPDRESAEAIRSQ